MTNRDRMFDFVATATTLPDGPDLARLQIDYLRANRPQLVVHPPPGGGNFRTDDIRLIPVLPGTASTTGSGVPDVVVVKGARNMIAVTVWNTGTLAADQVHMRVAWMPFTLTAGAPVPLPAPDPFSVPPGGGHQTVEIPWDLPSSVQLGGVEVDHFCVRVDIDRYVDPAHPESDEIVVFDNWAQSNFSTKWLRHGSPSERAGTVVTASNVVNRDARYEFEVDQDGELFRVYLGTAWRALAPGEEARIELAYESLAGDPLWGPAFEEATREAVATSRCR